MCGSFGIWLSECVEALEVFHLKLSGVCWGVACVFGDRAGGAEEVVAVANLFKSRIAFVAS